MSASTDSGVDIAPAHPLSASPLGLAWFGVSVAAAAVVFWEGVVSLVDAWSIPEYSHGPIIPLISLFLFLREMRAVPPPAQPVADRWPGYAVAVVGLLIGFVGDLARIDNIVTYGMIVWIAGMVLICFGFRRGALFWPAVLHLGFMLPLPQFVYWQVSTYLQLVSSEIGVWLIRLIGVPVFLDGNIIDLGVYKLQVAEACSGLRYLFPMLSFSYVFAVLYQGPVWHKLVLLLSAAPITVAMNSFRIGMIGVLVDSYGIEHAEGFLHTFEGWVIFIACVAILFALAALLQRLTRRPRPISEVLDVEFTGLDRQLMRIRAIAPSKALLAFALTTVALALAWPAMTERETSRVVREPFVVFPTDLGAWSGRLHPALEPNIERVLGADDYFSAVYDAPSETAAVDLFMAYYHDQTDGTGIHSPEVCIPAGGWEVSSWETKHVTLENGTAIELNRAIIQKGTERQLVYFWFDLRGRRIAGDYEAKFLNVMDSLLVGRSDGALVRLITSIDELEEVDRADARLMRFMESLVGRLASYVPA